MRRMSGAWIGLCLSILLLSVTPLYAQERSIVWERWDVEITNVDTTNNRFDVIESYEVRFNGTFRFGSAVIPETGLEAIRRVEVYENGEALRNECTGLSGTYCVERDAGSGYNITYYFFRPASDVTRRFEISYQVIGALRIYAGGDQLWWDAISDEHFGFPILEAEVTVRLPRDAAPREGVDPIETYGAAGEIDVNGSTVVARAVNGVSGNESFSLRIQYPHNPNARVPIWQSGFDAQREYEATTGPLVNLGSILGGLVVALGGGLLVLLRYQAKGRDPKVGPVPEYLPEPPSDLSPAIVGTLLDERADVRDVVSIILDMARRGYLVIEENQQELLLGLGGRSSKFVFKRTDKSWEDLQPYEKIMMERLFSNNKMERSLDSLRNSFYTIIPFLKKTLYDAVVEEGLFNRSPESVRNAWTGAGSAMLILGFLGVFFTFSVSETYGFFLLCVPGALAVVGLAALVVGSAMPAKTQRGAEEAAKWTAFRRYMTNLERYAGVEDVAEKFDEYLPYAIMFGINNAWVNRFRDVPSAPIPPWYYPTYLGGPWGRGYVPGTPMQSYPQSAGLPGELARAGDGGVSFDDVSTNMSRGLESVSSGLTTLLNSAGNVITSVPQSASGSSSGRWSSGGSSWSGGGFSGGGGSGGGSRGFG
ncbi:MAG: DUF2207 domain-containing protein [Chloroflexota bacterium]|nr:DUF2207 domain-containing protein [Chloroflexota bacterium]